MTPHRALSLALLLALAACGELPRPFQSETRGANPLLTLEGRAGALVLPFDALPPGTSREAAEEARSTLAVALAGEGLPADTKGNNRESLLVTGRVELKTSAFGDDDELTVSWRLLGADGKALAAAETRRRLPAGSWEKSAPELLPQLAAAAAPELAAAALGPAIRPVAIPGYPGARLVLLPLETAPGDAATSLPAALAEALAGAGLPLGGEIEPGDLLLQGNIVLTPAGAGQDEVALSWVVVRASDGAELGEVSQRALVPAGSLERAWGESARQAAQGTAEGLLDLLQRLPAQDQKAAQAKTLAPL